jgi:hypothetical protein
MNMALYLQMENTVDSNQRSRPAKIVTSFDYPPIPVRDADWSAVREGYDAGDFIGRGRTEADAVADLLSMEDER